MRMSFHFSASHLLFFTLLCPVPRSIMPSPHLPGSLLPFEDLLELQSGLSHLQEDQGAPSEPQEGAQVRPQKHTARAQRAALASRLLEPRSHSVHLQERRQGESGGKKNEALTSIAGGLQAVSREKGGFGFRFGRKRWTDWRRSSLRQEWE